MKIIMENKNGIRKEVKEGFSWTTFFFGWIPSLIRGDIVSTLKVFILGLLTIGIYTDFKSRTINQDYKEFLLEKGYEEIRDDRGGIPSCRIIEDIIVGIVVGVKILIIIFLIVLPFVGIKVGYDLLDRNISTDYNISSGYHIEEKVEQSPNNITENNKPVVNNNSMYKDDITKSELQNAYNEYNDVLSNLTVKYGKAYNQYGILFEDGSDKEANLNIANEYFKTLDDALNSQWKELNKVLNEKTFKKLQKEQVQWIKDRDRIAEEKSSESDSSFKEVSFIVNQGKQTELRIRELNERYLNPKNL